MNLELIEKLPEYYRTFISDSKLVTVLKALTLGDEHAMSYYSVGSTACNDERYSPVFMFTNPALAAEDLMDTKQRIFLFDTEWSKLYSYVRSKYDQKKLKRVKSENYDAVRAHIDAHPVALFFKGCDDGHVGMRFKTEQEAMEFLSLLDVFEDVFLFKGELQYHN